MFQLIFDYEILLSDLPREVFLPWPSRNYQRKVKIILRIYKINNFLKTKEQLS